MACGCNQSNIGLDLAMTQFPHISLVLGGARSGKSLFAENLAEHMSSAMSMPKIYLATARAGDDEMADRIDQHKKRRGPDWTTLEAPVELAQAIAAQANNHIILVDCITLWLTNLLLSDADINAETDKLIEASISASPHLIFVSNEVGNGIVPENALARRFRDEAGRTNQKLAAAADYVALVTAGLPLDIKGRRPLDDEAKGPLA